MRKLDKMLAVTCRGISAFSLGSAIGLMINTEWNLAIACLGLALLGISAALLHEGAMDDLV